VTGKLPVNRTGGQPKPGLRMRELTEATGLPKSTILHYLQAGLLPEPVKTSPNMAYYEPVCVDRLRLIRNLQSRHRLSLAQIKRILAVVQDGDEVAAMLELNRVVFGPGDQETVGLKEFCRRTGLTPEEVQEALANELLIPLTPGRFDQEDIAMGRMSARSRDMGLQARDARFYAEGARLIVDGEMDLWRRVTADLPVTQDAQLTLQMTQSARLMRAYVIDRIFQKRVMAMDSIKDKEPRK